MQLPESENWFKKSSTPTYIDVDDSHENNVDIRNSLRKLIQSYLEVNRIYVCARWVKRNIFLTDTKIKCIVYYDTNIILIKLKDVQLEYVYGTLKEYVYINAMVEAILSCDDKGKNVVKIGILQDEMYSNLIDKFISYDTVSISHNHEIILDMVDKIIKQ